MTEIIVTLSLLLGVLLIFIAGIGILRFPDTLCRAHALSKALTLGLMLVLFALMIKLADPLSSLKLFLAIVFQFVTTPISGHVFALYATKQPKKAQQ
ncbi:MAG: monovalent cation/H(+) antiporter subunit G [Chlamydiota bacterium]|nr:monovalent cation/H(+) antiporter subunit G [Chlamydiota bacterium]